MTFTKKNALRFWLTTIAIFSTSLLRLVYTASRVLDLGSQLPELLEKYPEKGWLVEFYAPWCHYCQQFEPTYNDVAETIYHRHDNLIVGRVDCSHNADICRNFEIVSFPTILFIKQLNELRAKYEGSRAEKPLVSFVERLNGPDVNTIATCQEMQTALDKYEVIILSTLRTEPSNLKKIFISIARAQKTNYWFFGLEVVDNVIENCSARYELKDDNIYILKNGLTRSIKFVNVKPIVNEGNLEELEHEILAWMERESFPLFNQINSRNYKSSLSSRSILVMAILDEYKPAKIIHPHSLSFRRLFEKFSISYISSKNKIYDEMMFGWTTDMDLVEYMHLGQVEHLPNVMVLREDLSYHLLAQKDFSKNITEQDLSNLISKLTQGNLEFQGGDSLLLKIPRTLFKYVKTTKHLYRMNPTLLLTIFIFPALTVLFVVYTTCFDLSRDRASDVSQRMLDEEEELEEEYRPLIDRDEHLKQD